MMFINNTKLCTLSTRDQWSGTDWATARIKRTTSFPVALSHIVLLTFRTYTPVVCWIAWGYVQKICSNTLTKFNDEYFMFVCFFICLALSQVSHLHFHDHMLEFWDYNIPQKNTNWHSDTPKPNKTNNITKIFVSFYFVPATSSYCDELLAPTVKYSK